MTVLALIAASSTCLAVEPDAPAPDATPETTADRVHVSADLTVTSQYFFRGIIQETDGFIFQPSIDIGFDLLEGNSWSLSATIGTWSSFHDEETGSADPDDFVSKWYEADFYAGLTLTTGIVTTDLTYVTYTSPNDAYTHIDELILTIALDDSEWLGDFALSPYATVAIEIGSGQGDGGAEQGVFLGLGVEPAHTFEGTAIGDVTVSLPIEAGFSLDDYYEGPGGDESFGYLTAGLATSIPLPAPTGFGSWSFHAGVDYLLLGDSNEILNAGDDSEFIAHAGVSFEF